MLITKPLCVSLFTGDLWQRMHLHRLGLAPHESLLQPTASSATTNLQLMRGVRTGFVICVCQRFEAVATNPSGCRKPSHGEKSA